MEDTTKYLIEELWGMGFTDNGPTQYDETLRATINEINNLRRRLAWTYCAFCSHEVRVDDNYQAANQIAEHITNCEKHPLGIALKDNDRLRHENERLRQQIEQGRVGTSPST